MALDRYRRARDLRASLEAWSLAACVAAFELPLVSAGASGPVVVGVGALAATLTWRALTGSPRWRARRIARALGGAPWAAFRCRVVHARRDHMHGRVSWRPIVVRRDSDGSDGDVYVCPAVPDEAHAIPHGTTRLLVCPIDRRTAALAPTRRTVLVYAWRPPLGTTWWYRRLARRR